MRADAWVVNGSIFVQTSPFGSIHCRNPGEMNLIYECQKIIVLFLILRASNTLPFSIGVYVYQIETTTLGS